MFLSKRRNGTWYVFYTDSNGNRTSISTRSKYKSDAVKFLTQFRDKIKAREESPVLPIRLQDFINNYMRHSCRLHSYKTSKDYKAELIKLMDDVGNVNLTELTPKVIQEYIRERGQKSIFVLSKCSRYLKTAFNWAMQEGYLLENPCKNIKPVKIPEKMPLFISESDFQKLLDVMDNSDLRDVVIFAAYTGFRKSEIINLTWAQVDLQNKIVILDGINFTTKSKRVHSMPLNQKAYEVLLRRKEMNHDLVFTMGAEKFNGDFVCKKFKKYIIKAGLNSKLRFHDCRHTFASWLVQKGISIFQVSKLLNHSNVTTTMIYSHLSPESYRSAVNILD